MRTPCLLEMDTYYVLQEAYKDRERNLRRRWKFMSKSDAQLYSVAGSEQSSYLISLVFPNSIAGLDSF